MQEQIAQALADENQVAAALPRFEGLAKKAADPFRQVQLAIQAADLKVRLGRSPEALRDFETMLGKLRPDSWLHREVRRKIEEVFLRNDDSAGLVAYYEQWTKKEPDDVEALVRLGRTLAGMGRAAEARTWFDKAVKLAPSRRDLRLALISQLVQDQKFSRGRGRVSGAGPGGAWQSGYDPGLGTHWCCGTRRSRRASGKRGRRRSGGGCWMRSRTMR